MLIHRPSFAAGVSAAADTIRGLTGSGTFKPAPGYCAGGWLIMDTACKKCGAERNQNCPSDIFDAGKVAAAVLDLSKIPADDPYIVLIARARSWTAGDCSFEHGPTMALIKDLTDALEGKV